MNYGKADWSAEHWSYIVGHTQKKLTDDLFLQYHVLIITLHHEHPTLPEKLAHVLRIS